VYTIDEYRGCLERLAAILDECRVRYCLTGGAAFIAYGDPRTTQDVDLVVDVERLRECLPELLQRLKQNQFLLNEETICQAVRLRKQFQLLDLISTLKLDMYPRELVPGELDRTVQIEIMPGLRLPVLSIADLIASKLVWISKGSQKSRRDVKVLMRIATEEDQALVRELAGPLGLVKLLEEVLAESDEIED
jgi:hypothetical protein